MSSTGDATDLTGLMKCSGCDRRRPWSWAVAAENTRWPWRANIQPAAFSGSTETVVAYGTGLAPRSMKVSRMLFFSVRRSRTSRITFLPDGSLTFGSRFPTRYPSDARPSTGWSQYTFWSGTEPSWHRAGLCTSRPTMPNSRRLPSRRSVHLAASCCAYPTRPGTITPQQRFRPRMSGSIEAKDEPSTSGSFSCRVCVAARPAPQSVETRYPRQPR